jgi:CBS-domain-containing membrane protein
MTRDFFGLAAEDLMSREVITIPLDTSLPAATQMVARAEIGGAPVVDRQGRCVGLFSQTDLTRRTQLEQRAARMVPVVPGCVCSDWEVVEHAWDTLPADADVVHDGGPRPCAAFDPDRRPGSDDG